jgi:ADP-ribosylglycohydrolase
MRIAPVCLPHLGAPSPALWADAILAGAVTHNDASSLGACVGMVGLVWEALGRLTAPEPAWWLDRYVTRARVVEGERVLTPRHPTLAFRGPIWRLVDTEVRQALAADLPVLEACDRWHSGAFLLETIPSVLYILARHSHDPEEALVRAVNDTVDNDTVAAIVGAAVGALHGRQAWPVRWITALLGRTEAADDGRLFRLLEEARARFVDGPR